MLLCASAFHHLLWRLLKFRNGMCLRIAFCIYDQRSNQGSDADHCYNSQTANLVHHSPGRNNGNEGLIPFLETYFNWPLDNLKGLSMASNEQKTACYLFVR